MHPDNWSWAHGQVPAGPCALVDVDGVIADGWHRQHFLSDGRRDYKNFFANAPFDTPIEGAQAVLEAVGTGLALVLLTSRPDELRFATIDWLTDYGFRWDLLVMRGRRDAHLSSADFKRRSVVALREHGFEPRLAFDDDQRNIDVFRSEGIDAYYIHSGYYG